eukprot:GFUD01131793.1.p1 GENE.GFUD01131793.1~~GFUD01131793.1.p1  ORF type:complete len:102 (-),score=15.01 GFUD01131793.1:74-358(-)
MTGGAIIIITVTCLWVFSVYCRKGERTEVQKSLSKKEGAARFRHKNTCKPDIIMSLAGAAEKEESIIDDFSEKELPLLSITLEINHLQNCSTSS